MRTLGGHQTDSQSQFRPIHTGLHRVVAGGFGIQLDPRVSMIEGEGKVGGKFGLRPRHRISKPNMTLIYF